MRIILAMGEKEIERQEMMIDGKRVVWFNPPPKPPLLPEIDSRKRPSWRKFVERLRTKVTIVPKTTPLVSFGIAGTMDLGKWHFRWHCWEGFEKKFLDNESRRQDTHWHLGLFCLELSQEQTLSESNFRRLQKFYGTSYEAIRGAIFEKCDAEKAGNK